MNPVKTALEDGRATIGSWFGIRCSLVAERFGAVGFDWVIIDLQHGTASWDGLASILQALQLGGTRALVRVTGHDPAEIGRALDIGAIGVVVPLVSTPDEARRAAQAMRYPPHGTRSFGLARNTFDAPPLKHDPFCVLMVETIDGMDNLDAIAATPGVDCVLMGAVDLAISMGLPDDEIFSPSSSPAIITALDKLAATCERHGVIAGNAANDAADAQRQAARGIRFIPVGAANGFLIAGAKAALNACRETLASREPVQ
jgi:4-hydroxy-2-oxoheptanedioate aldolase